MAMNAYGKKTLVLAEVRDKILALFQNHQHVLIGKVSTELRCSLAEAEHLMNELVFEKVIREMTSKEVNDIGVTFGYVLNR